MFLHCSCSCIAPPTKHKSKQGPTASYTTASKSGQLGGNENVCETAPARPSGMDQSTTNQGAKHRGMNGGPHPHLIHHRIEQPAHSLLYSFNTALAAMAPANMAHTAAQERHIRCPAPLMPWPLVQPPAMREPKMATKPPKKAWVALTSVEMLLLPEATQTAAVPAAVTRYSTCHHRCRPHFILFNWHRASHGTRHTAHVRQQQNRTERNRTERNGTERNTPSTQARKHASTG